MHTETNPTRSQIQFSYSPYSYFLNSPDAEKWQVLVEIAHQGEYTTVTVTEDDIEAINGRIARNFAAIATQIYYEHLREVPADRVVWKKHDIRDNDGNESLYLATLQWTGRRFIYPKFECERILNNFFAHDVSISGDSLVLDVGYPNTYRRKVELPIERFPELARLSHSELRSVSNHKHGTVLYYYQFKSKLVLRDAIKLGQGLVPHPLHMPHHEFIYGKRS